MKNQNASQLRWNDLLGAGGASKSVHLDLNTRKLTLDSVRKLLWRQFNVFFAESATARDQQ